MRLPSVAEDGVQRLPGTSAEPRRTPSVLVVEDAADIRELITSALQVAGFDVTAFGNGTDALQWLTSEYPDLILLDLVIPGLNGLEVLQRVRQQHDVPVILLTSVDDEESRLRGFRLGADDYVTKPFSHRELVARVQALLRRSRPSGEATTLELSDELSLDLAGREVLLRGAVVPTTAKEFDLLAYLAQSPGRAFSREQLLRAVWDSSSAWQQASVVTEYVRRLRLKIEPDPQSPRWIHTVRGVGYRFERREQSSGR